MFPALPVYMLVFNKNFFYSLVPKPEQEQEEPNLCQSPFDDSSAGRLGSSFC